MTGMLNQYLSISTKVLPVFVGKRIDFKIFSKLNTTSQYNKHKHICGILSITTKRNVFSHTCTIMKKKKKFIEQYCIFKEVQRGKIGVNTFTITFI